MCQLVIYEGIISREEINLRHAPCNCRLNIISCSSNENCLRFATEKTVDKLPKSRAWKTHKLIKE